MPIENRPFAAAPGSDPEGRRGCGPAAADAADGSPPPAAGGLVPAGALPGGWVMADLQPGVDGEVLVVLANEQRQAAVEVTLTPRGARREFLQRTPFGDVSYRRVTGVADSEAVAVTRAFAAKAGDGSVPLAVLFPHLAVGSQPPGEGAKVARALLAPLLQANRLLPAAAAAPAAGTMLAALERDELFFDPPGIAEFLAPEIVIDGAPVAGHVLRSIYLPPVAQTAEQAVDRFVLGFEDLESGSEARVMLAPRDRLNSPFATSGALAVGVGGSGLARVPPRLASLVSWVVTVLGMRQSAGFRLVVPADVRALRALSLPEGRAAAPQSATEPAPAAQPQVSPHEAFNLALNADCGQACVFCSVKTYVTLEQGGEARLEEVVLQLRRARERGVRELRLNGIEPLTLPHVLDVVRAARELGFERMDVFTTGRPLADAAFRRAFLARAPRTRVSVPLYGSCAAVHDKVTGRPGAFDEVRAAIDGLAGEPSCEVVLTTVLVRENTDDLGAMVRFAAARGLEAQLDAKLPFPMRQTLRDTWAGSALRETDIAERVAAQAAQLPAPLASRTAAVGARAIRHPCVLWHVEQRARVPLVRLAGEMQRLPLAGTEYRQQRFLHGSEVRAGAEAFAVPTVPCPAAGQCALATVCPAEHYALYAQLHGLDEFRPVSAQQLYDGSSPRAPWER